MKGINRETSGRLEISMQVTPTDIPFWTKRAWDWTLVLRDDMWRPCTSTWSMPSMTAAWRCGMVIPWWKRIHSNPDIPSISDSRRSHYIIRIPVPLCMCVLQMCWRYANIYIYMKHIETLWNNVTCQLVLNGFLPFKMIHVSGVDLKQISNLVPRTPANTEVQPAKPEVEPRDFAQGQWICRAFLSFRASKADPFKIRYTRI